MAEAAATVTRWTIDASHSTVEFAVRHMMISTVKGHFGKIEGYLDAPNINDLSQGARLEARIDASTVDTREPQRDEHLRSADFFDVANYPHIEFRSTRIEKTGENRYKVTGDLSIRGVTKEVTWDLTYEGGGKDPWGNQRVAFHAETKVNRKDFGLQWNMLLESGGVLVGDEVRVSVDVELVQQGANQG
ncbi:YceI family protein [Thermaerobacter sp. PB12/4term]|uniref:YceI family protein n=1 Tax=Thermaerobacter sp. PB12/4term TaxID=2293838 RepID=UPI000E32BA31|nr:YceI family protein [Thermaerobacter sp. PB12/4term]QIA26623.1 YceI family protein [Thermaerobacter sp. PB12/4term]